MKFMKTKTGQQVEFFNKWKFLPIKSSLESLKKLTKVKKYKKKQI